MGTVVIGLGNTTLGDDGVGPVAARLLAGRLLPEQAGVRVLELGIGGLTLMEAMVGFDRAVVLDAVRTGRLPAGTVVELDVDDLAGSLHETSVHDLSLPAALSVGRALGLELPAQVRVLGVEVVDTTTFGETLTAPVAAALPELVECALAAAGAAARPASRPARESVPGSPSERESTSCA